MTANDYFTKRINYYNGQSLLSNDFIDQQDYHDNRQQLHARMQHLQGITEGLGVTIATTNAKAVAVAPGAAVDGSGRLILLAATTTAPMPSGIAAGAHAVVIAFAETPTDPADAKYVPGNTRFTQTPGISIKPLSTVAPPDVVLATLTVDASGTVTQVDTSARTYSGLRLTGPEDGGFDLRTKDNDSLVVEHFAAGDTSVTRLVTITNTGNVGIGTTTPGAPLEVAGMISSKSGGFKFPDGTIQTTSVESSVANGINLNANTAIRFADGGVIGSGDANHQILFRRSENILELREFGDIVLSPGATAGATTAKVVVKANGNVGIGAASPGAPLAVAGIVHSTTGGFKFPDDTVQTTALSTAALLPRGLILMWAGALADIPAGWALCDGTQGTPDLRDKFVVGAGSSYSVGATGGADQVTLTVNQMPAHTHVVPGAYGTDDKNFGDGGSFATGDTPTQNNVNSQSTGGNAPHENRPPYRAVFFIMKL
ncbi:Phage tail fiber protein [Minicystis rosea]|nr:Phage tail fiber protein [Minicystis rosea]